MDLLRAIYLDFDGVLHPEGEPVLSQNRKLLANPNLFCWRSILEAALVTHPDVRIIVSSDWRRLFPDASLIQLLGPDLGQRFAGVVTVKISSRAEEILHDAAERRLARWLALDDHPTVHAAAAIDPRFVACEPARGLSCPDVQVRLAQQLAMSSL